MPRFKGSCSDSEFSDTVQPHLEDTTQQHTSTSEVPELGIPCSQAQNHDHDGVHCIAAFKESHFIVVTVSLSAP